MKTVFSRNSFFNHVFIALIAIIIGAGRYLFLIKTDVSSIAYNFIFYRFIIVREAFLIESIVLVLLLTLCAVYINNFNNRHSIVEGAFQRPGLIFVVFSSCLMLNLIFVNVLIAASLLLVSLDRLLPVYRKAGILSNCFDAGFSIAIATCFYPGSILLFPMAIVSLLYIRPFNWREITVVVLGLLTPFAIICAIFYLTNNWANLKENYLSNLPLLHNLDKYILINMVFYLCVLFLGLVALLFYLITGNFKKIIVRRYLGITAFFLITAGVVAALPYTGFEAILFFLIPLSYLISNLLTYSKLQLLKTFIVVFIFLSAASFHFIYFNEFLS